jgi:hypothetical protein
VLRRRKHETYLVYVLPCSCVSRVLIIQVLACIYLSDHSVKSFYCSFHQFLAQVIYNNTTQFLMLLCNGNNFTKNIYLLRP